MRFAGEVGYRHTAETAVDVHEEVIIEKRYFGDVVRATRQQRENSEKLLSDNSLSNSISIVADAFASEHFMDIIYVRWAGRRWTVSETDVSTPPRLVLRLGEVYNGPTPAAQSEAEKPASE